jgi:hypothetical protein
MEYKGHPVIDTGTTTGPERGFPAKYAGVCVACRGAIKEGQPIERGATGGYAHVECPTGAVPAHLSGDVFPTADEGMERQEGGQEVLPGGLPNGVWTIEGPRGHRTYRIATVIAPKDAKHLEPTLTLSDATDLMPEGFRSRNAGRRVLELLTGPDNTASYQGMAWYDGGPHAFNSGIGKLWKFGKQPTVEILLNLFAKLVEREEHLDGYTVHFARTCYRCNRLLTTPESIKRGIGPICAAGGWD